MKPGKPLWAWLCFTMIRRSRRARYKKRLLLIRKQAKPRKQAAPANSFTINIRISPAADSFSSDCQCLDWERIEKMADIFDPQKRLGEMGGEKTEIGSGRNSRPGFNLAL